MPIYIHERQDIQRLLRDQVEVIEGDLYVVSEEFGKWDKGNRRIDLLVYPAINNVK